MKFWLDSAMTRGRLDLDSGDLAESAPSQAKQCNRLTRGLVSEQGRSFRFRLGRVRNGTAEFRTMAIDDYFNPYIDLFNLHTFLYSPRATNPDGCFI